MHKAFTLAMILALLGAAPLTAQMHGHGSGQGYKHGHHHGADGTGHDEVTMPGLRGENVTDQESAEMALMFRRFDTLSREVTNLPDGIRTVTRSSDPEVMDALIGHVSVMLARVATLDDPKVFIQSPTLDIFFLRGAEITTDRDLTEDGIVVIQTATDPALVTALQTHAAEVSDMVNRGMAAVHERMMQSGGARHGH